MSACRFGQSSGPHPCEGPTGKRQCWDCAQLKARGVVASASPRKAPKDCPKWVAAYTIGQSVETRVFVDRAICWVPGQVTNFHKDGKPVVSLAAEGNPTRAMLTARDVHVLLASDIRPAHVSVVVIDEATAGPGSLTAALTKLPPTGGLVLLKPVQETGDFFEYPESGVKS